MNRTLKRVLGLTGSVALGLAGAVAFASGAQAHHTQVAGTAPCLEADGTWEVTWSATDWNWKDSHPNLGAGWITGVTSTSDSEIVGDFALDTDADPKVLLPYPDETPLTATQVIPAEVDSVTLKISGEWSNGQTDNGEQYQATVLRPTQACEQPEEPVAEPSASAVSDCFSITVTAQNNSDVLAEFVLTPSEGEPVTGTPAVEEPLVHSFLVADPESEFSVTVTADGEELGVFEWEGTAGCPEVSLTESCEGISFDISVPAEGTETTFDVTTSEGGEHSVTVAPGESGTIEVPVEAEMVTVDWSYTDGKFYQPGSFDWTKPPCEEETTPAAEEQLPTTGSSMTIMISAAAALVAAAAVLFVVARRRRAAQDW